VADNGGGNFTVYDRRTAKFLWNTPTVQSTAQQCGDVALLDSPPSAYDIHSGDWLWNFTSQTIYTGYSVASDTMWINPTSDGVTAYDCRTMKEEWTYTNGGVATSNGFRLIDDALFYPNNGGMSNAHVWILNATTGEPITSTSFPIDATLPETNFAVVLGPELFLLSTGVTDNKGQDCGAFVPVIRGVGYSRTVPPLARLDRGLVSYPLTAKLPNDRALMWAGCEILVVEAKF